MTVTYSLNVANARLTGFTKLLLRWKGSIYKLLYREMIIFCVLYYMLSMSYRFLLNDSQKLIFEKCVEYCRTFTSVIPLSFVLGFYVSIVVTRWWQQYLQIPWPDKAVLLISGYVRGDDERGRIIRRTLARYLILMQVLTFQAVSTSVRRRFPTNDHIQEVGLFTAEERLAYDEIIGTHGKWWVPAQWFISLIIRARRAGRIKHDYLMDKIVEELHAYRSCCGFMFSYDWISIPLVYTQTVSIATYMYFGAALIGRQYLDTREGQRTNSNDVDYYIPVFTILEFLCFMGWLKVAEQLINPYGEDDDDFELNCHETVRYGLIHSGYLQEWSREFYTSLMTGNSRKRMKCLDRNLLVSYTIVDEMYNKHPKLVPDIFWDKKEPILPYTKSSLSTKLNVHPHLGSTVNLAVEPEDFLPMETIMEEDHEDFNYSSPPTTSMVDYTNTQPNWFQENHSVVQMDPSQEPSNKYPTKPSAKDFNQSEIIDNLRAESNQSSRCTSRTGGRRFLPGFVQESKIVNMLFGGSRAAGSHLNVQHPSQYQNYSNLLRHHQNNHIQHSTNSTNPSTFVLKTPTKKRHHPHFQNPSQLNESSNVEPMSSIKRSNHSLMTNQYSMNMSNASIGGNLNATNTLHTLNNLNNTSLSATTMNSQQLSNSHQNLTSTGNIPAPTASRSGRPTASVRRLEPQDDLTSSNNEQSRYEEAATKNHRNLRLNRTSTLNQASAAKYSNLPTAPVLPTFGCSSASKNRMSPFMNRLRTSLNNFSTHHYRNLSKLGPRNKRNSFSSAVSLKSKCDNPTSDQLVTPNGFHFPQAYIPPHNPNQYLPLHLQKQQSSSTLTLDQENELNNNLNIANLNQTADRIEIKISPASQSTSRRNLNAQQSLSNVNEEENLIVMDDRHLEDKEADSNVITKAADILKASNESELNKLKSATKPYVNNQDSVPLTSGTQTETQSKSSSKSSSTRSSLAELNSGDHEISNNENQSLINKNETSSSSNSNATNMTVQTTLQKEENEDEEGKPYSPNEDCHEERYEESLTSSNDSLSPYESNQCTVNSFTQLLEEDKNNKEY